MKFFKEPIMEGCTDYVATGIIDGGPFKCIRVTHWDHIGFRGIESSEWFNQQGTTPITEEEFFEALHMANTYIISTLGGTDAVGKLKEASARLVSTNSGAEP